MSSSIDLNLHSVPDDCLKELERLFMDGETDIPCRIGKVTFDASIRGGEMVHGFGTDTSLSFSLHMNAGSFRISDPAETCPLEAVATMAKAMGWIAEDHGANHGIRQVKLRAVFGHANIPDLIKALDTGLLVYKLRVIDAEPKIVVSADLIQETMILQFGW